MYNVGDLSVPRNYYMSVYPSSMQERIQYVSTDFLLNDTKTATNGFVNADTNKRMCEKLAWYPTLNFGCRLPGAQGDQAPIYNKNSLAYSVQITFSLRFRGVRFTGDGPKGVQIYGNESVAAYGVPVYLSSGLARLPVEVKVSSGGADKTFEMTTDPGSLTSNCRIFTFSNRTDAVDFINQHRDDDPVPNASTTTQYGTNSDACNNILLSVHAVAVNKNAQSTVSNFVFERGEQLADQVLRAGPITDEENDRLHGMNKMVVDGSMYDPATQTINAEGYVDLNQLPDDNEGSTHEGDTAASTSWTTAGACVYGTEANNAQLQEINLTHAGPEFEEVETPVSTPISWETKQYAVGNIGGNWW